MIYMAKKVFIAAGHGGSDPGAVANGFKEKNLNLAISLACQAELERHGVSVRMSRTKDEDETLTQQTNECNAFAPDVAVNIHNNAGGGDGVEVFHGVAGGTGKTLAVNILDEAVKIGQNSRGAKTRKNSNGGDFYGFIRQPACPAVIVECAFVDNIKDIQIIDTAAEQKAFGVAIAKGVLKTLGIAYKEQTATNSNVLYCVQTGAFAVKANADALASELKGKGYDTYIVHVDCLYKVQVGAFSVKSNADAMLARIKGDGYSAFVVEKSTAEAQKPAQKSIDELAREVINGEWGNGAERKNRLTAAGYDYVAVQNKVNDLL
jgi:N-acetylmuramoyl-L-alanine amidase